MSQAVGEPTVHGATTARIPPGRVAIDRVAPWLWPAIVIACFCVPLFVGLGRADLGTDEAIYSFGVDVMLEQGDWLAPKSSPREDIAFLEKPPLKFWLVAAPIELGLLPHDEFGLRFWDALFGALAFLYVFAIGCRLAGPVCGASAVLLLFAHRPLLFEHGLRGNTMEAPLLLCYCGAMCHYLAWRTAAAGRRARGHVVAVGLFFVLGFMTKFVAALFLPAVLVMAMLLRRDDRQRAMGDWRVWGGTALLVAALCVPWFIYAYARFGADVWRVMFASHVYTRFTSSLNPSHVMPWHYYVSRVVAELQASHVLLLSAAGMAVLLLRTTFGRWPDGPALLLWFALPVVLMSFGTSKLYYYAYPFLPPVALGAGCAAAAGAGWIRRFVAPPLHRLDALCNAATRRITRTPALRVGLTAIALAAAAVTITTLVLGHVRVVVAGSVLLRTSSVFRPAALALVAIVLAGHARRTFSVVPPLLVLALVLPLGAYRDNMSRLREEPHPLRSLRDCLKPIAVRQVAGNAGGPGVYVESNDLLHPLSYYLRGLGGWHQLPDGWADVKVFTALYVKRQPVLLSDQRYDEFLHVASGSDAPVLDQAIRTTGMDRAALQALAKAVRVSVMKYPSDVLLLPAPYDACGAEFVR